MIVVYARPSRIALPGAQECSWRRLLTYCEKSLDDCCPRTSWANVSDIQEDKTPPPSSFEVCTTSHKLFRGWCKSNPRRPPSHKLTSMAALRVVGVCCWNCPNWQFFGSFNVHGEVRSLGVSSLSFLLSVWAFVCVGHIVRICMCVRACVCS